MDKLGHTLRGQRQQLGLSQAKLSELTGLPQHMLSAFELGKVELSKSLADAIAAALSDDATVARLASRRKRYREHSYAAVPHAPDRVAKHVCTDGNSEYRELLELLARQHAEPKGNRLPALSLFSGCGGFSYGFSAAGFEVKGFLELNSGLRQVYKDNFPNAVELGGDITAIENSQLRDFAVALGPIDVIIGGPPCQGFSLSGKRLIEDPRNALFKHYLRFVDTMRPKVAVIENVRLLTSMRSPSGVLVKEEICQEFRAHGYKIKCYEINAREYGVPQHRERVLFVAVRGDLEAEPSIPLATHGARSDMFSDVRPTRSFADACSDLPYIESGDKSADAMHEAVNHPKHVIEWLWDVPEGRSAHDNDDPSKRPPSGYNTTYKRQVWNEPASTVQTTFGMISGCRNVHPIATRSLTIREAARIQSFPDSFRFPGDMGTIRTGIGNAVPPLLAFALARHIKERFLYFVEVASL